MALRVSTVSGDVSISDLGLYLAHPTTNRDLEDEFSAIEIKESDDLLDAIRNGSVAVDDGTNFIDNDDYEPTEVLHQQLGLNEDVRTVSHDELKSVEDIYIWAGVFPVSTNSTAAITRNIYSVEARWITWQAEIGDTVVLSGNAAAGRYTIESISDQQNLIVVENIVDSTGGNIEIYHPVGATRVGVDPTSLSQSSSSILQTVLNDLDAAISGGGVTEAQHRVINQLVHWVDEDYYQEYTYNGARVVSIVLWTDNTKTIKIREFQYTYAISKVSTETIIQYDDSGVEAERLTLTYSYSGRRVSNITSVRT